MARVNLLISGRVQGVTFRASTKRKANQLGINGWVRNTEDGKVEIIAEAEKNKLKKLIDWTHKGPSLAKVKNIKVKWEEEQNEFNNFKIKR